MSKPKIKDGKVKNYYLDKGTISEIKTSAGIHGLSESSYLDFMVKRDKLAQNPIEQVKQIQFRKEELQTKIDELNKQEKVAVENASRIHEWQQAKRAKKPEAIKIIKKKILERDFAGAEEIAKTWQRMTGISAMELISEANQQIKVSGV